jgi:phage gpG-like protein
MFNIQIDAKDTIGTLNGVAERVGDLRTPLNEFAAWKEGQLKQNFNREIDPDGNPWAELAPSTLDQKRKRGAPLQVLTDTGTLKSGIAAQPARADGVAISSEAGSEYGIWHLKGTRRMPQRVYLGFGQNDGEVLRGFIEDHIAP